MYVFPPKVRRKCCYAWREVTLDRYRDKLSERLSPDGNHLILARLPNSPTLRSESSLNGVHQ